MNCSYRFGIKFPRSKEVIVYLLIIFLIFFPKGGVKFRDIPLTWGYVFLILVSIRALIYNDEIAYKSFYYSFLAFLPFHCIIIFTILINGYVNAGYVFSLFLNFSVFPYIFFIIFPKYLSLDVVHSILKGIKRGVFFVAWYGIFIFIYKFITGYLIEIPLLTTNLHDRNQIEILKCIDRGGVFKLISTYNNGNIYGVCILMFLPLFNFLEQSKLKKLVVVVSLVLTLSRTVWLGLFFSEFLFFMISKNSSSKKIRSILILILTTFFFGLAIQFVFPFKLQFLFDRLIGNRIGQLVVLKNISWFSYGVFEEIYEIVYLGVLKSFGVFGLIFYLLGMIFPLFCSIYYGRIDASLSEHRKLINLGLVNFLFVSFGDGGLLLIPVMCFYLILCMLALCPLRTTELKLCKELRTN